MPRDVPINAYKQAKGLIRLIDAFIFASVSVLQLRDQWDSRELRNRVNAKGGGVHKIKEKSQPFKMESVFGDHSAWIPIQGRNTFCNIPDGSLSSPKLQNSHI